MSLAFRVDHIRCSTAISMQTDPAQWSSPLLVVLTVLEQNGAALEWIESAHFGHDFQVHALRASFTEHAHLKHNFVCFAVSVQLLNTHRV